MLLMSLLYLFDPLQMMRRTKLTSQNLRVIETINIPDGTPHIRRAWSKKRWVAIPAKEYKAFVYIPEVLLRICILLTVIFIYMTIIV